MYSIYQEREREREREFVGIENRILFSMFVGHFRIQEPFANLPQICIRKLVKTTEIFLAGFKILSWLTFQYFQEKLGFNLRKNIFV